MQVWTEIQNSLPFYNFYQRLANSNTTKEALNCTASIAADNIVDATSFITGVLLCDPKTSFSQIRPRLRPDLKKSNTSLMNNKSTEEDQQQRS